MSAPFERSRRGRATHGALAAVFALLAAVAVIATSAAAPSAAPPPLAESIGNRIVRFDADAAARATALPSLALIHPMPSVGPPPAKFRTRPEFSIQNGGRVARIAIAAGTSLYGTGEVAGPLLRNGRTIICWNTDAYAYGKDSESLYQSQPWVLAVRGDGSAFGVLADTPGRTVIDLSHGIEFRAQGPPYPLIMIERASPDSVVMALADLTGHMPLPPEWALGYQQCRYSYTPDREVLRVAREFRRRAIPCDVIWMDIDYMDGYRSFTFSPSAFPNPDALNDTLHTIGFHSVWIIDPGIKYEPGYFVYDQGTRGDDWVEAADRSVYTGRVWPGTCVFPDFTRAATRSWWASLNRDFLAHGADGIWNDMNEPAVFGTDNKSMPETNWHRADPELGGPGPHLRYHNVYGMLEARATREGMQAARPARRPFVLSRANYLGGQRYAAAWTGDNTASWEHLAMSVPMVLNLGLSGQPFAGPDIGGFKGLGTGEMFARWMGFGALLPFARAHTEKGNPHKEPWSFGPEVEASCRRAIDTRYRLMPYLYTVFREASRTGLPVARPLFFADPADPKLRSEDQAFMLGSDLIVAPNLREDVAIAPRLPRGIWRELALAARGPDGSADPSLPRLYQRGGSIVPLGPVIQHMSTAPLDTLELSVCLDDHDEARGMLYEDAGDGYGYLNGEYRLTRWMARQGAGELRVETTATEGNWPAIERPMRVHSVEK